MPNNYWEVAATELQNENKALREALDALRGRYRIYAGWPHFKWAGHTDIALLKMADDALGDQNPK